MRINNFSFLHNAARLASPKEQQQSTPKPSLDDPGELDKVIKQLHAEEPAPTVADSLLDRQRAEAKERIALLRENASYGHKIPEDLDEALELLANLTARAKAKAPIKSARFLEEIDTKLIKVEDDKKGTTLRHKDETSETGQPFVRSQGSMIDQEGREVTGQLYLMNEEEEFIEEANAPVLHPQEALSPEDQESIELILKDLSARFGKSSEEIIGFMEKAGYEVSDLLGMHDEQETGDFLENLESEIAIAAFEARAAALDANFDLEEFDRAA